MRRYVRPLTLAGTALALALTASSPAQATRSDNWAARTDTAIAAFQTADTGTSGALAYSYITAAIAHRRGWDDPQVATYLAKLYALRNPDGGWGTNSAWDPFGDGTTNPASTTYTVTIAGHVGPVLLEAWQHGKVPTADIQTLVNLLVTTQQQTTSTGRCVAYSRSTNDAITSANGYCVHNVDAIAGAFLQQANGLGFTKSGLNSLIVDITRRETAKYNAATKWWNYSDANSGLNDSDHNSAQAEAMYTLVPQIGREVAWYQMTNTLADNEKSPIAHIRLASMPTGPGPAHSPGESWWCYLSDQWMAEADGFITASANLPGRLAQIAYYASLDTLAC